MDYLIEEKIKGEVDSKTSILATKEDVARAETKIETSKAELLRWMFVFWIGQVVALFGLLVLFMKK